MSPDGLDAKQRARVLGEGNELARGFAKALEGLALVSAREGSLRSHDARPEVAGPRAYDGHPEVIRPEAGQRQGRRAFPGTALYCSS
jgi:hypothetical protein